MRILQNLSCVEYLKKQGVKKMGWLTFFHGRNRNREEVRKGEFYIRLEGGSIASHLIKVRGRGIVATWNEETIKDYVKAKIKEIDPYYEAELELFKVKDDKVVEVWIFISALASSKSIKEWSKEWLEHHIKNSFEIESLKVEPVSSLTRMMNGV